MLKFLFIASLLVAATLAQDDPTIDQEEAEKRQLQAENAQYSFGSRVNDAIYDGTVQREETRDGLKTKGSYSYSDGFVRRTVHYEADENGYRVVKEETEDIGDGPVFNPDGVADVESSLTGRYTIKLDKDDEKKHYKDVRA